MLLKSHILNNLEYLTHSKQWNINIVNFVIKFPLIQKLLFKKQDEPLLIFYYAPKIRLNFLIQFKYCKLSSKS